MSSVYVSCRLPGPIPAELARSFDVTAHAGAGPPSREELLAGSAGCDGLLVTPLERVDGELLDAAGPRLRIVANHAVGYDNVDVEAATARGVVVTNTPGVLTRATAELTIALVLDLLRRITEGDRFLRRREPWVWSPVFMLGSGLDGKTLGIVGLGRIGREVARLGEAFGMRVVYASPRPKDAPWERLELAELLAGADVISLHCPLAPETRHLIDARALKAMRQSAVLVNTTRGPVVDEAALVDALRAGTIAGAALDVYEREPEVHAGLLGLEQVVLSPHLGSATVETRVAMGRLCVTALEAVLLEGRCPENAIDPAAWRAAK